jgi:NSS family neurotransmitter:Na+ symporter
VLSFNDWSDISFIGDLNFLDSIDYLANQFLMPIGGMMVAIFAGWFLKPNLALDEFSDIDLVIFKVWRFFIKFISPVLVAAVFVYQLVS